MQSFVWKPGISVSTASLGNSGVIDTLNPFDLDATESGWEYQPYELAGSSKRSRRRRLVPKCANCACSICCALGICAIVCPHAQAVEQEIKSGTPLRRTAAVQYEKYAGSRKCSTKNMLGHGSAARKVSWGTEVQHEKIMLGHGRPPRLASAPLLSRQVPAGLSACCALPCPSLISIHTPP